MTMTELRAERNARLAAYDFRFLKDVAAATPEAELTAIAVYRQALRDLPSKYEGLEELPADIDWPTPPPF